MTIDDNDPSTGASRLRVIFEMNQEFSGLTVSRVGGLMRGLTKGVISFEI